MLKTPVFILDLDNTIYSATFIGGELFTPLFAIMEDPEHGITQDILEQAKKDVQRIPFQKVADTYNFPEKLKFEAMALLRGLSYEGEMSAFSDYHLIKEYHATRFLVTSGFTKLQSSKISKLGIEDDFEEIFIIDPDFTDKAKKDVFEEIIKKYGLNKGDVFVIGDDPESEIQAAIDLQLHSILLDPDKQFGPTDAEYTVKTLEEALLHV